GGVLADGNLGGDVDGDRRRAAVERDDAAAGDSGPESCLGATHGAAVADDGRGAGRVNRAGRHDAGRGRRGRALVAPASGCPASSIGSASATHAGRAPASADSACGVAGTTDSHIRLRARGVWHAGITPAATAAQPAAATCTESRTPARACATQTLTARASGAALSRRA